MMQMRPERRIMVRSGEHALDALAVSVRSGDVARFPPEVHRAHQQQVMRAAAMEPAARALWRAEFEAAALEVVRSVTTLDLVSRWSDDADDDAS